jgi:hypothetical protein
MSRAEALAAAMAVIYNVKPEDLKKYGQKRADAMILIGDYHHDTKNFEPDWQRMESLLRESYTGLRDAVQEKG